jgi:thiaminase (transcriptional activator TenA)
MLLSQHAWDNAQATIVAIQEHPFNQELASGTLSSEKFSYYIEQDAVYLKDFSRCHAIIAAKVPVPCIRQFLNYADYALIAEQDVVHQFFREKFKIVNTGLLTMATLCYTSYLLRTCYHDPIEVAVAAVLPCFWVYRHVGLHIAKRAFPNNPYQRWIDTYVSDEFGQSVNDIIHTFDALAKQATVSTQQAMLRAFAHSTCLEWHFWNDAYHQTHLEQIL